MPIKKILMLVGDFVEDYEVMVPFQMLLMVGHQSRCRLPRQKIRRHGRHRDPRFRRRPNLQRKARPQFPPQRHVRRNQARAIRRSRHPRRPGSRISAAERPRDRDRPPLCEREKTDRRNLPRPATPGRRRRPHRPQVQRLSSLSPRSLRRRRPMERTRPQPRHRLRRRQLGDRPSVAGPSGLDT